MNATRSAAPSVLLWLGLGITSIGALSYFLQHTPVINGFDTRQPGLFISLAGIGLSLLGFILEPARNSAWHKRLGVKILPITIALTALYVAYTYFAFRHQEVAFSNGGVTLAGTLLIPNRPGPHPAIVMMHGAGEAVRLGNYAEAQSLARRGIAVLIYDKRGSGASVGGHYRFDGYQALASDAVAAFGFLKGRHDIDVKRIGLWGTSEGGWTAVIAASKIDDPAFLIIVSGGPLTPAEQGAYEITSRLRSKGFSAQVIDQAVELNARLNAYFRTGLGRDELLGALRQAQSEDWFEAADSFPRTVPHYEQLSQRQRWWRDHMAVNVAPLLARMDFPLFFVLGGDDPIIPAMLVRDRVADILSGAGHDDFEIRIFPGATHNLVASPVGCAIFCPPDIAGIGPVWPWFVPGYLDTVSDWVIERVERR